MNKCILMGRLTKDAELRQTQGGVPVASFSMAVERRFQKGEVDFINCVAWRQTAEFVTKWFRKGSMIAVVGSVQTRKYTDNEGKERTVTEVVADEAYFTGSKNDTVPAINIPAGNADFTEIPEGADDDLPF